MSVWIIYYDRDTVAFYQKPHPQDPNKTLNADLVFPSLNSSFGGEIIGAGARQDNPKRIIESMKRQGIKDIDSYDWYIKLRQEKDYKMTGGFGLGIERFIAWLLCQEDISKAAIYPVKL